jgi:type IV secretory pathway TraG/TraD family ATPase VirD4
MHQGLPPVSVILDEFSTFAYPGFPRILETARDSKILFTFALQSITALDTIGPAFRERLTAAPGTIMLMQSWDQASTEYFQRSAPSIEVDQLTVNLEERGMLWKKYERTGRATARTIEEPLVPRSEVGFLPRGQMHMLVSDPHGKPRYVRLYVPPPSTASLRCFQPMVYPPAPASNWRAEGANLRFKDLDFLRKFPRISGQRGA